MSKFKVGDHVRAYTGEAIEFKGKITYIFKSSYEKYVYYYITEDGFNNYHSDSPFYKKQLKFIPYEYSKAVKKKCDFKKTRETIYPELEISEDNK